MVADKPADKLQARAQFRAWLLASLARHGVPAEGTARTHFLSKAFGVSTTAARKWLTGEASPDASRLVAMVDFFGPAGENEASYPAQQAAGTILEGSAIQEAGARWDVSPGEIPAGYVRLPLLAMEAGMGANVATDDPPDVVMHLDIAEWWARLHLPKPLDRVKIITGRGDSNAGLINHGDIVFVDTLTDHFDGEGLYVFNWNGRALIKRLVPNLRTGKLQIISANPAYPPEDIAPGELEQLHIAGRVAAWYTLRSF